MQSRTSCIQKSASPLIFSTISADNFLKEMRRVMDHMDDLPNKESKAFQVENFVKALSVPLTDLTK